VTAAARLAALRLARAPGHTAIRAAVLALAVALLGSMLLFIGHSLNTMAGSAVRSVPLDWQGPVASRAQAERVAASVAAQPGISESSPAATAPFAAAGHQGRASTTGAGSGAVLAVSPDYLRHIKTLRLLQGSLREGGVVLDQQLAATLQARIGDRITLTPRPGAPPRAFTVTGVALVTAPDVLFQPLNPQAGPAPAQPPANIAVMPIGTFARTLAPSLPAAAASGSPTSIAVPGAQRAVQWQVQVQLDPHRLGHSPAQALTRATRARHRVERSLPGQVQFVDNLSEKLTTASEDALYAEAMYILLAGPGALIALGLAYLAALGTVERDRRDIALLRARGASRRDVVVLAGVESGLLGGAAGLLGAVLAFAAVGALVKGGVALTPARAATTLLVCVLVATLGGFAARAAAGATAWRGTVIEARRRTRRTGRPLWQRLYIDVMALVLSGLVYWLTASTGFSAVVNPDSNPTLSLSVYMFFAPALLWIGATLLLVRLRGRLLGGLSSVLLRGLVRDRRGDTRFLLASASRRAAAINRGVLAVGLLLAFGVNLGLFAATYDQQSRVDAQLTIGADVVVSTAPGVTAERHLPARIGHVPGVTATTPVDHSYAYVGPDLQDTYGIDASSFTRATSLRDSYFIGDSAAGAMRRLSARPDGILVSKETIADYSLRRGDLLRLRVLDHRSGRFRVVPFHVAGVVQEFPSAPRDSFMVANLRYLQAADHAGGANAVFAKTSGDPPGVARRVAAATRSDGTSVRNVSEQTAQTVSAITAVDLHGIASIEEAFVIVLAAAAVALFLALAVAERRKEFATMAAIGATLREVAAFLSSEAAFVLAAAVPLAALLGWVLAQMMIALLQHAFDPPPDHLAVPWAFLGGMLAAAVVASAAGVALARRRLQRLPLGSVLREQ
jgi:putative ABC transport system permease protein